MGTIVVCICIAIVLGALAEGKDSLIGAAPLGAVVGLVIALLLGCFVPTHYEILQEEPLMAIEDGQSYLDVIHGSSIMYSFVTVNKDNKPTLHSEAIYSDSYVIKTNKYAPSYIHQKKKFIDKRWYWFAINLRTSNYVLYIPDNNIEYKYNIKD